MKGECLQRGGIHLQEVSAENIHIENSYSVPSPKRPLIFISADFNELSEEIQVLKEVLEKLAEIYIDIEYSNTDPSQSFQEREAKIQESALYIILFSDNSGLINKNNYKPLMQLEYEVAKERGIPFIIYFKEPQLSQKQIFEQPSCLDYEVFKNNILANNFFEKFKDVNKLEQKFVKDIVKFLQKIQFEQKELRQNNLICLDSLHLLCRSSINQQIRSVARDKYISDIYLERGVEKEIGSFVNFDQTFLDQVDKIIEDLIQISRDYRLSEQACNYLLIARKNIINSQSFENHSQIINELKNAFYYNEIENVLTLINFTIRLSKDTEFHNSCSKILLLFKRLPWVNNQDISVLSVTLLELRRKTSVAKKTEFQISKELLDIKILPAKVYDYLNGIPIKWKFANDLIKEISNLVELQAQNCVALVANAGYGKTNIISHLAYSISKKYPVVLLSGQVEITSKDDIEYSIQRQLESSLPGNFINWISRIEQISDNINRQCLFILIDGVNENSNLPLFIRLLKDFIVKIEDKKIKIILSCRNISWDLFSHTLKSSLFKNVTIELNQFNEKELNQAIQLYFEKFNIRSSFDASNLSALRNPLLLRFFCEAYQNCQLEKVDNLELLSVFDLYVERVESKITEQLGLLRTEKIIDLLTQLGYQMWVKRKTSLKFSELEIATEELNKSTSIYNLIRSENLIFEENLQILENQITVRFIYDEFMEYIIARSWLEQLNLSQEPEKKIEVILQEIVSISSSFSPAFGAILFLDKMLKRNGELVNRIISLFAISEDEFVASRQIVMLKAFEKIDTNNVNSDLIIALDKFERTARDEIKEKLAPIIIQVLSQHPNHPITKSMISRMLEIGNTQVIPVENISTKDPLVGKQSLLSKIGKSLIDMLSNTKSQKSLEQELPNEDNDKILRLPSGRYHYKEEMKLNAISILIGSKNSQDIPLIEEGINSLGKMELHSALTALTSLDLADDELLYKMLAKYYDAYLSEYRIYCAWLLRNRYGKQPSEYLTGLLMDKETRVHHYTLSLFEERKIEKELIAALIVAIEEIATIKNWHLTNIVKVLGKTNKFYSQDIFQSYGQLIVDTLTNLSTHSQASLRLEVYRSLLQYDEFIERKAIISAMEKDSDIYICKLARSLKIQT